MPQCANCGGDILTDTKHIPDRLNPGVCDVVETGSKKVRGFTRRRPEGLGYKTPAEEFPE